MHVSARESNCYRVHSKVLLQGLNEAQREAVLHGEGPALVAAGPGSGKTTVITRRLLYLIQECKIPPQNILVITFTKEAAKSMQNRFVSLLQEFQLRQSAATGFVSFGTFHSYFYQIIRSVKKYSEYQLITQQEKYRILKPILQATEEEVTEGTMNRVLAQISYFKNTGRFRGEGHVSESNQDEETQIKEIVRHYEAAMTNYKRMDFDDMLYLCKRVLSEDKALLEYWQRRFSYLLIDEYQDINPIQYELIQLLIRPPYNLFVVGDDDQAIYGFRGSDSQIFQNFLQNFQTATKISLATNYRCGGAIVKASRRLIEHNQVRVVKELASTEENVSKGQIRLVGAINNRESYEKVASALVGKEPEMLFQEAVLFRTNAAMQMLAVELTRERIPFVMRERCESIYDHFLVKDIMDYFLAAKGCRERSLFLRLLGKQRVYLAREALCSEQVDLTQVKEIYRSGFYESRQAVETIEALERHLKRLAGMRLRLGISYILHAMDYEGYLRRKAGGTKELLEEWKELLDWLQEDAGKFPTLELWQEHQALYGKVLLQEREAAQREKKGVHLLTLHASKGLEFQRVYIMNLNEGTVPKYRRGEVLTQEKIEEERRLFYVGMTRAKVDLELHYLEGTKENPRVRSRFLEEIRERIG